MKNEHCRKVFPNTTSKRYFDDCNYFLYELTTAAMILLENTRGGGDRTDSDDGARRHCRRFRSRVFPIRGRG